MLMLICQIVYSGISTKLYEKITVTTGTAVGFTNVPARCNEAFVIIEANDIRYRTDGVNPTSTLGMPISAGQSFIVEGFTDISRFKAIAVSTTAYISVQYIIGN